MRIFLFILFAVIVILFVAKDGPGVNDATLKNLRADIARCRSVLNYHTSSGLIVRRAGSERETTINVDEGKWARVDHDTKMSVALAAYCVDAPSDGRYSVSVRGNRDGQNKGSVTNGHWFSP